MITVTNKRRGETGEYIGRPSPCGNPFRLYTEAERPAILEQFREYAEMQLQNKHSPFTKEIERLWQKWRQEGHLELLCWCEPLLCHGDIIKEILQTRLTTTE